MDLPLYQVDAFSEHPFAGNPAAVCLLDRERPAAWMQAVAAEMNLSETAFLLSRDDGSWGLRWFTPAVEVELCGHATLASAHVLWTELEPPAGEQLLFRTLSGELRAVRRDGWIELDFPSRPVHAQPVPAGLEQVLGVQPVWVGKGGEDLLVEVASEADVRSASPELRRLASVPVRGVILTARSEQEGYDIVSRFFAPGVGVDEDPVTGSAHCALGPYWAGKLGKRELRAYQASRRGGSVRVELHEDRVRLLGHAVTVLRGSWVG